jgi:hypothetical protein
LRTYESKYMGSFARDALRKSNNLVVRTLYPNQTDMTESP